MNTHVLLGCGKSKRPRPWKGPIVDLYTGNLYRARLAVARLYGGPHWILSAFHGLRRPEYEAFAYDRTLDDRDIWRWYSGLVGSVMLYETNPGDRIVVLASRPYWSGWDSELRLEGRLVETPLEGLAMGEQLRWLKAALDWSCGLCGEPHPPREHYGGQRHMCSEVRP